MNHYLTKILGSVYLFAGLWFGTHHSVAPWSVSIGLVFLAGLAFAIEAFWLVALVPTVVLVSLYPITGELLVTEQDIGLCGLLGGRLLAYAKSEKCFSSLGLFWPILAIVWLGAGVFGYCALPMALPSDELSFYTTKNNALQQIKVLIFGVTLVPMLVSEFKRNAPDLRDKRWQALEWGFIICTIGVCATVLAERYVSFGLWDWDRELRVAGPCMTMHIGDQHIDAYWSIALPFIFRLHGLSRSMSILRLLLFMVVAYAIYATMSRATIIATSLLATLIIVSQAVYRSSDTFTARHRLLLLAVSLLSIGGIVTFSALLWYAGSAVPARFAATAEGLQGRIEHWRTVSHMLNQSTSRLWLGTGLGSYPFEFRKAVGRPEQPVSLVEWNGETGVRMYTGEKTYVLQLVSARAPLPWQVRLQLRKADPGNAINLAVCHQVLLQSNDCVVASSLGQEKVDDEVSLLTFQFTQLPNDVTHHDELPRRQWSPTALSFFATGDPGTWIEVFDLSVVDANGNSVIKNANYKSGSRNWFFVSDDHLIWRAKNCFLHLIAETGLLGLGVSMLLCASVLTKCIYVAQGGRSWPAFAILLSVIGVLPIGMFGTLIDVPWILLLILILLAVGQGLASQPATEAKRDYISDSVAVEAV